MKAVFIAISSILATIAILPYVRDVCRKKTKPRIVSWVTWSLLFAIASAASFSDRQYASAILTLLDSIGTMTIVILGWRFGDKKTEPFDIGCQIAAMVGLILWLIFNSPAIAIIATISIDFIASLPTLKHSWKKPYEETAITFLLGGIAGVFTLMAVNNHKITAVAFPIYLVTINFLISTIIYSRKSYLAGNS
jgi:uncharacterized membrane protein YsdA (DUF1294 family)